MVDNIEVELKKAARYGFAQAATIKFSRLPVTCEESLLYVGKGLD
jgi:hypothetical protein